MVSVQLMCARLGMVTGKGLAGVAERGHWTGRREGAYAPRVLDEAGRRPARGAVTRLFLALIVSAAGISDAFAAPADQKDPNPLVLYHWWGSSSEMAALNALASVFKTKYPGVAEKRTIAPDRGDSLFMILERLMRAGKPPDAIVMQTGYAMRPFINAGLLAPLDDLWAAEGLEKVVPPTLQAMHRFDGHYYSVPIDVQRTNLIWYNKRVLDKYGIDPDTLTTWERFFDAATGLRAGGVSTPIQIAAGWSVAETFGNIMASLGLDGYEDWVNGKIRAATDPRIIEALNIMRKVFDLHEPGSPRSRLDRGARPRGEGGVGLLRHGRLGERGLPRRGASLWQGLWCHRRPRHEEHVRGDH